MILADSSSDGSGGVVLFLFAIGPLAGLAIWGYIKARYRNRGARYMPERVVDFTVTSLEKGDTFLRETKSSSARLTGANHDQPNVRAATVNVVQEVKPPAVQVTPGDEPSPASDGAPPPPA